MMTMQLQGVPMPLLLKDENGNLIPDCIEDQQEIQARNLVTRVKACIDDIENVGSNLACGDEVNIYPANPGAGFDRPYFTVSVYGGLNSRGMWSNYFKALSDLLLRLESEFEDVWVPEMPIDCCDDVFTCYVGIYPYDGQLDKVEDLVIRQ